MNAKAGANVVENQSRLGLVAYPSHGLRERQAGQFLIAAVVVLESRDDDARKVTPRQFGGALKAGDIIILVLDQVRAVLGRDTADRWRAPGNGAVI